MSEVNVIDDLFNVSTCVDLAGKQIYLRTLSEVDLQARDMAAMSAARVMRKQIKDPSTAIYQQYVGVLGDVSREEMIGTLHNLHDRDIISEVAREINPLYKPYPKKIDADANGKEVEKDLTLDDRLDVQDEREEEMKATMESRVKEAERRILEYDEELKERSDEDLMGEIRELQIKSLIDSEYYREHSDQTILLAAYSDDKCTKRFFRRSDEIKKMNPAAKKILLEAYNKLDNFDLWTLKN